MLRTLAGSYKIQRDGWAKRLLALSIGLPSMVSPAFANGISPSVPPQTVPCAG